MKIFQTNHELRLHLNKLRKKGATIGMVPTMGALHAGHLSLIRTAQKECDQVICTIYVNPNQFNNSIDLENYPRTLDNDLALLEKTGCDIVFNPANEEMYQISPVLKLSFGRLEKIMEGKFRPGHFSGVGLIVSKLCNIISPDKAFFGLKDFQQFVVIQKLFKDLSFNIELIGVETVREPDGLAMSSRNQNLNINERKMASIFSKALENAASELEKGASIISTKDKVLEMFNSSEASLEYFEIMRRTDLRKPKEGANDPLVLCIAGYVGKTRLIDNILVD